MVPSVPMMISPASLRVPPNRGRCLLVLEAEQVMLAALGVPEDQRVAVKDVAPVLAPVQIADPGDELRPVSEHPIRKVDLVRGKLRRQAAGEFPEQPPVALAWFAAVHESNPDSDATGPECW